MLLVASDPSKSRGLRELFRGMCVIVADDGSSAVVHSPVARHAPRSRLSLPAPDSRDPA
jgi:hypothetical protein